MAFYSYNELRSHQGLFNFVLSNRGGGKTFGAKVLGIKSYIKSKKKTGQGEQFAYVRRYDSEFETKDQFFDDIIANGMFEDYEFIVKGYKGYIREKVEEGEEENEWEILCFFIPLSVSQRYKSTPYPNVTKIFFDEFIIDKGNIRYVRNEVVVFLELFETIDRKRDKTDAFFLANTVSLVNPYFSYFKIYPNPNKRFTKSKDGLVVVEMFTDDEFVQEKLKTRFGRLIQGTEYGDYAINNQSLRDNTYFIQKRPSEQMRFLCSYIIEGKEIGVWECDALAMFYVDEKVDKSSKQRYSVTDADHMPDIKSIQLAKMSAGQAKLKLALQRNLVFFSSLEVQDLTKNVFKYI